MEQIFIECQPYTRWPTTIGFNCLIKMLQFGNKFGLHQSLNKNIVTKKESRFIKTMLYSIGNQSPCILSFVTLTNRDSNKILIWENPWVKLYHSRLYYQKSVRLGSPQTQDRLPRRSFNLYVSFLVHRLYWNHLPWLIMHIPATHP